MKNKPLQLVYVHGSNGMGKSTLARYLIMCAGGSTGTVRLGKDGPAYTTTRSRLALVGKYNNMTGGSDGIQPYSEVPRLAIALLKMRYDVFMEGLMTPGIATCQALHDNAIKLKANIRFIRLDIGFYQANENVKRRRMLTGNTKPYDPINLKKESRSCDGWLANLATAGLPVWGLDWKQAKNYCEQAYGLSPSGATHILDM